MALLTDLIGELDAILEPDRFRDYGPNGLQVPGPDEIRCVVTGVSAHAELFAAAAERGADLVLTHHGMLWDRGPRRIDAAMKRRLKLLFDHDMGLAAYHLPLDAHPEHGNNALIAQGLGATSATPFGEHDGAHIGVAARFEEPAAIEELVARVEALCGRPPLVFAAGPDPVRSLGIVSGAGGGYLPEAAERRLDAFLTGEPSERDMAEARERGVTYLAAGHYATETFGVQRLGELLARRFGIRHEFVDVPNPI
jgi:dinuclear metal center YbgI/SA1388 family protein